jgi:uncharacterized protein (TIGR02453 family)
MTRAFTGFDRSLLDFLEELAAHNDRDWFAANKPRYEQLVLAPALDFIAAMAPRLEKFAPQFDAIARRQGGSLMRVYRDTRFARDKAPYKTNVGIQFRHAHGKDVHAPGYYVHIEPGEVFLAAGMWRPEPEALAKVRLAIVERPAEWKRARDAKAFRVAFALGGRALVRAPRGFPRDHPHADDLKRQDFIASVTLPQDAILSGRFADEVAERFRAATPFMKFLCRAVNVPY